MSKRTRYYVTFSYPGTFVSETSTREIDDPLRVEWPEGAFAYQTFARSATVIDGEELLGVARDRSGTTYRGEVWDLERVQRELPDQRILISNMRINGWNRVVRTIRGNFQPLGERDVVLTPSAA